MKSITSRSSSHAPAAGPFGSQLRALRRAARFSQLDLSLAAGTSQRHLSFLETSRARPGRDVVLRLTQALNLHPQAANALLHSAGFAPISTHGVASAAAMAPIRDAVRSILAAHEPAPAVLVDEACEIILNNQAFEAALDLFSPGNDRWRPTDQAAARNLLKITLHPDGPARALLNFPAVVRATLSRAIAEAPSSARLRAVLAEIASYPNIQPEWLGRQGDSVPGPVVQERYLIGRETVSVVAVITTMGAPMDTLASGLRIESYLPVDAASRAFMTRHFGRAAAPAPAIDFRP